VWHVSDKPGRFIPHDPAIRLKLTVNRSRETMKRTNMGDDLSRTRAAREDVVDSLSSILAKTQRLETRGLRLHHLCCQDVNSRKPPPCPAKGIEGGETKDKSIEYYFSSEKDKAVGAQPHMCSKSTGHLEVISFVACRISCSPA
jgi:hypothetical protein